jgi:peroxiredoxin
MFEPLDRTARRLVLGVALLGLAACGGADDKKAESPSGVSHPLLGKRAPELGAESIGGDGPKTLAAAQGKVVILDFWGTYCDPCKKSFPKYQEIVDQFAGDVAVVAVSVDEPENVGKDKLLAFAKENHAKFAIVWDKDHSAAKKYGMDSLTMPSSFIIDRTGTVRHLHVGFRDGEEGKITDEVKALLH